jgi:hypothetical protein
MLAILFDEAGKDASACCGEQSGPNTPMPGGQDAGPGGGRTGAVLLSPFVRGGITSARAYNHYSLLRSLEDLFGLSHLGYAAAPGLRPFGRDVYRRCRPDARTWRACTRTPASAGRAAGTARRR